MPLKSINLNLKLRISLGTKYLPQRKKKNDRKIHFFTWQGGFERITENKKESSKTFQTLSNLQVNLS